MAKFSESKYNRRVKPELIWGTDTGLGEPVRPFEDTFSAVDCIMEHFFPELLTSKEKSRIARFKHR